MDKVRGKDVVAHAPHLEWERGVREGMAQALLRSFGPPPLTVPSGLFATELGDSTASASWNTRSRASPVGRRLSAIKSTRNPVSRFGPATSLALISPFLCCECSRENNQAVSPCKVWVKCKSEQIYPPTADARPWWSALGFGVPISMQLSLF